MAPAAPAKANESNEAEESVAQVVFACLQHGSNMIKYDQIEVSSGGNQVPHLGWGADTPRAHHDIIERT